MESANKRIIYEESVINNAFYSELENYGDPEYSRYHKRNADWYRNFSNRMNEILGFNGKDSAEFFSFVANVKLTQEQNRALMELRREPMFKRLMGETALEKKVELERILGCTITHLGMSFADGTGARTAIKTEEQLDNELDGYSEKLAELLSSGSITEEQYDNYMRFLEDLYAYFTSCSKGEQLLFRKLTDAQYEKIERKAEENGLGFSEQLCRDTEDLRYDFDEVQELQKSTAKR